MRTALGLALLLAACGTRRAEVSPAPRGKGKGCDHPLTAYVTNTGVGSLDVFLGGALAGSVRPGRSGRFVLSPSGRYLHIRPTPTRPPSDGRPRYSVSYQCEE